MSDRVHHPDVDPTSTWSSWGEAMEYTPGMLMGILEHIEAPISLEQSNTAILAIAQWLQWSHHRNISVHRMPGDRGEGSALCVVAIGQCAGVHDGDIEGLTVFSFQPTTAPEQMTRWPHIPQDELTGLIKGVDLDRWLARIHAAEQSWHDQHPEQLVAQVTLTGDLKEDEIGNITLPQAIFEGIDGVLRLDVRYRDMASERNAWVNRAIHGKQEEIPNPQGRQLMAKLVPQHLLDDPNFAEAAVAITYHRPSATKLADIAHGELSLRTCTTTGEQKLARL